MSRAPLLVALALVSGAAFAEDAPRAEPDPGASAAQGEAVPGAPEAPPPSPEAPKTLSGMSVLGNQEAPKALVIVPWKSSELGASLGISTMLDDSRQPVDKDVFLRALSYYEIRSDAKP